MRSKIQQSVLDIRILSEAFSALRRKSNLLFFVGKNKILLSFFFVGGGGGGGGGGHDRNAKYNLKCEV